MHRNFIKGIILFLFLFLQGASSTETLPVVISRNSLPESELDLLTVNGMRQALTKELLLQKFDSEKFWKIIEGKKLSLKLERELFQPLFLESSLVGPNETLPAATSASSTDSFKRASFQYELNKEVAKSFFSQTLLILPDLSLKSFYIMAEISLDSDLSWSDVGVSKKENFTGVITESWKKWAKEHFKDYENIIVLERPVNLQAEGTHAESVILKWTSEIRRSSLNTERKSGRYEVSAHYVLVNAKTGESLVAFDFPMQKREVSLAETKELSSTLASLVFNLLNSQASKITSGLETNKNTSAQQIVELKVVGIHGLSDIYQMNAYLSETFKEIQLKVELKTFSSAGSTVVLKTSASSERLFQLLGREGGKFSLNEQKILLFNASDKTFAILPKEQNN